MNPRMPTGPIAAFLVGVVTGLALCAIVALYVTNAPVPFVSKVQRATENVTPQAVDPNQSLYSPQIPAGAPGASAAPAPAAPFAPPVVTATPGAAARAPAAAPVVAPTPIAEAPRTDAPGREGDGRRMLQTGAYRSADDADAMRARLALLGLDAKVSQSAGSDGTPLYRVRLGPYGKLDDLNGIRRTLSDNGIEAQEVTLR